MREGYRNLVKHLPLPVLVQAIADLSWGSEHLSMIRSGFREGLMSLVSDPSHYNIDTLKEYMSHGANINIEVPRKGETVSLAEILLDSEIERYCKSVRLNQSSSL